MIKAYTKNLLSTKNIYLLSLVIIFLTGTVYFLSWPVTGAGDTDLWFHLNSGRYLFEHNKIPDNGFFSFIAQDRSWSNYYWLSQAAFYSIHKYTGYHGLIFFRTIIYLFTFFLISKFLLHQQKNSTNYIFFSIITALLFIGLPPRYFMAIRPHIFSYLFTIIFIYLLDSQHKKIFILPVISLLWINLHGIVYPLMLLICGSYLGEAYYNHFKTKTPFTRQDYYYQVVIIVTMWMILASPFGIHLLSGPFDLAQFQHLYIRELESVKFKQLFQLDFSSLTAHSLFDSITNLIIIIGLISMLTSIFNKNIRLSHLLLFSGGLFLVFFRAYRFRYEVVFLALPLIRHYPLTENLQCLKNQKVLKILIAAALVIFSITSLKATFPQKYNYPFSTSELPAGTAAFLKQINYTGKTELQTSPVQTKNMPSYYKILNNPDQGGYLQWVLGDRYQIFADLQLLIFSELDIYLAANAFNDPQITKKFIQTHTPDFIIWPMENPSIAALKTASSDYLPIFFDSNSVLLINHNTHPEIAKKYWIRHLNPFFIDETIKKNYTIKQYNGIIKELTRCHSYYPMGIRVNQLLTIFYLKTGNYIQAEHHATLLLKHHPGSPHGYALIGDLLFMQKKYSEALSMYQKTEEYSFKKNIDTGLLKKMYQCYLNQGNDQKAYESLARTIKIFSPETTYQELYELGRLALKTGKKRKGLMLLKLALVKLPTDMPEAEKRILTLLSTN
jgi:tetratricopeptide (TPR) repeat protein